MRVLHLTTHLNVGGITTYILRLIKPLKALGIETYVLSSGGECTAQFIEQGAKVFELPIRTKSELHPRLYLNLPAAAKIIRDQQIDVLHAHTRVTQVMAYWLQFFLHVPVLTTCHGFYKKRLGRMILPAWGNDTIAISQSVGDHLREDFRVPSSKIKIVNNGVDIEGIDAAYAKNKPTEAKASYGFKNEDPVIGIVARLVSDKGHEYLIRAIALLKKKRPSIRLLIVGDGSYRKNLADLVEKLEVSTNVVFCGNVQDVTRPIAAMDIFALPATWREGFGLSIVEAMACYKPVIVSNIWSLNTLIENNVTGILIEPKEVEPLAKAIEELLGDRQRSVLIGQRGRKMVEEHFSIGRMARQIADIYDGAAKKTGASVLVE